MMTFRCQASLRAGILLGSVACAGDGTKISAGTDSEISSSDDSEPADDSDDSDDSGDSDEPSESDDSGEEQQDDPVVTVETADPVFQWADACTTFAEPVSVGAVVDASLDELSGIAVSWRDPAVLWVHEDHLGEPAVYALDTEGNTLATVTLDGAENADWEDIAIGPCGDDVCIYIAEIGNNAMDRTELGVYVLPEPDLDDVTDGALTTADWTWYGFDYPDSNQNAEALAVTADGLPVVLTKSYETGTSNVYIFPSLDAAADVVLTALGTIITDADGGDPGSALTAASMWPDDSRLLIRTYASVAEVDLSAGLSAITAATITPLAGATEMHGEAVTYDSWRGGFWQVSEGVNTALWYVGCAE